MIGKLRLISGLVLFVFVLGHFLNHAMGIVSLSAMDGGIKYTVEPWRTTLGTIILTSALTTHIVLAIYALFSKRTLKIRRGEIVQIILGILIPIMLSAHVLSTRGGYEAFGFEEGYSYQLYVHWVANPIRGVVTASALLVVWVHACLGWHFWLRLKPWYQSIKLYAFSLALIIPVLGLVGIISGGFRVLKMSGNNWLPGLVKKASEEAKSYVDFINSNETLIHSIVAFILFLFVCVYIVRWVISALPGGEMLNYRDISFTSIRSLKLRADTSVLDLLRQADISHASVCGGRGRCSTCRVRIDDGMDNIPPPGVDELRVLERIGAPPNVRLACQIKPRQAVSVTALLAPDATAREGFGTARSNNGDEQDVAILFADIRGFTKLSETQLPYDTAFLLNRYFASMGKAIEGAGGHLDKFIGDGVMAIFGIDKPSGVGANEAIQAAKAMSVALEKLNENLKQDINEPLKIGIGIHSGKAIVGNMGYNRAINLTAIGDVVNTASRLESLTKELSAQLVVSSDAIKESKLDVSGYTLEEVSIRGRLDKLEVYAISNASDLY